MSVIDTILDAVATPNKVVNLRSLWKAQKILRHAAAKDQVFLDFGSHQESLSGATEADFLFHDFSFRLNEDTAMEQLKWCLITALDMNNSDLANSLIADRTNSKVQDALTPDDIRGNVALIVNVFYFKDLWEHSFFECGNMPFACSTACFMSVLADFRYVETPDWKAIILPYRDSKIACVIAVPQSDKVYLDNDAIAAITKAANTLYTVKLTMPRFKVSTVQNLTGPLCAAGLERLFLPGGLPRLSSDEPNSYVNKIIQKNMFDFTNTGTEARSVTLTGISGYSGIAMPKEIITFTIDQPFCFGLISEEIPSLIMTGRIEQPID